MFDALLFGGKGMISLSSNKTAPSSGNSKPAIIRSKVVLPHPEGPSREKNSPCLIVKFISSSATKSLKRFETFLMVT